MSKILIVDDEVRILMLIQTLLKGNGYETIAAKSGEEALGILAQGGIDVMITDLRMAPMDGLTLIKKVKETHAKLPMILLTAYASVETAIDAMKCGAFDYLMTQGLVLRQRLFHRTGSRWTIVNQPN